MILAIAVALLVVAGVVIALVARRRQPPPREAVMVETLHAPDMETAAPAPLPSEPEANPEPLITWTATLTETALDEAARFRLIDDLALLDAPWAIALLRRAYEEESSPELRERIQVALSLHVVPVTRHDSVASMAAEAAGAERAINSSRRSPGNT